MVFNQVFNKSALSMVRKKNGLLYAILGKSEPGSTPMSGTTFKGEKKITGNKIEVKLHGKLYAIPTVADGSAEIASVTPQYDSATWGGAEFDLCHYASTYAIPHSELYRFAGDEAKTMSYLDEVFRHIMLSYEDTLGTGIHGTNAPARTTLGSWVYAVDDGSTYDVYGGISRADSANADFRGGYVNTAVGGLTLAKIRTGQNSCVVNGGSPSVGVCGTAVYGKIQSLIEGMTQADNDPEWNQFGGQYVNYGGIKFVLDQRAPSATLGLLDPSSFVLYRKDINFTQSGIVVDPSKVATSVLPWESFVQLICIKPNSNAKMSGIDA